MVNQIYQPCHTEQNQSRWRLGKGWVKFSSAHLTMQVSSPLYIHKPMSIYKESCYNKVNICLARAISERLNRNTNHIPLPVHHTFLVLEPELLSWLHNGGMTLTSPLGGSRQLAPMTLHRTAD